MFTALNGELILDKNYHRQNTPTMRFFKIVIMPGEMIDRENLVKVSRGTAYINFLNSSGT